MPKSTIPQAKGKRPLRVSRKLKVSGRKAGKGGHQTSTADLITIVQAKNKFSNNARTVLHLRGVEAA